MPPVNLNRVIGPIELVPDGEYKTVAASTTAVLGSGGGAAGDVLLGLLVVPATTAAGIIQIKDGGGTAITVFAGGGTTALTDLRPFWIPLGMLSTAGGWSVITLLNESVIAVGKFT